MRPFGPSCQYYTPTSSNITIKLTNELHWRDEGSCGDEGCSGDEKDVAGLRYHQGIKIKMGVGGHGGG